MGDKENTPVKFKKKEESDKGKVKTVIKKANQKRQRAQQKKKVEKRENTTVWVEYEYFLQVIKPGKGGEKLTCYHLRLAI